MEQTTPRRRGAACVVDLLGPTRSPYLLATLCDVPRYIKEGGWVFLDNVHLMQVIARVLLAVEGRGCCRPLYAEGYASVTL